MCIALHWCKQLYFYFQSYRPCQEKLVYSLRRLKSIRWTIQHCTTCQFRAIEELIFAVDKSCYVINILKASEMKAENLINQKHVFIPHFYTLVIRCGGFIADIYSVEMMAFFSLISSINKQPCITVSLYI